MKIKKGAIRLYANPKAVITQFLHLPGDSRVMNIIERVRKLTENEVESLLEKVIQDFSKRHRNISSVFTDHFKRIKNQYVNELLSFSENRQLLLGAYFTKEYSIQSAALFNPSIVSHPDQGNLGEGEHRFIMSLRATGEGHISSIVFHTGIVNAEGNIKLDKPSAYFTPLEKEEEYVYDKDFIKKRVAFFEGFNINILDVLPDRFTTSSALDAINAAFKEDKSIDESLEILKHIFDTNYELQASSQLPINEKVIFPKAEAESMGMEDVRFVKFNDEENPCYYGTYTAYDGHRIKTQLIETKDFDVFKIRTLYGNAIADKGMALFPEKINGKYVMIARQGGEKMSIMFSDDLYVWDQFQTLMEPEYPWELLQLGNCGSPIKTPRGWLLLIHGVGPLRTYVISAILLDLHNPEIIVGRMNTPLIEADESEREGYVPNVVYTCGLLRNEDLLIIPYAVSDSATRFATITINEILNELT